MYILCKQFNKKGISGFVNLSKGKEIELKDGYLCFNHRPICYFKSQNAYDYFANNEDGKGLQRFNLSHNILEEIKRISSEDNELLFNAIKDIEDEEERQQVIEQLEFKMPNANKLFKEEHYNNGAFGYGFYNEEVSVLQSIYDKIKEM